MEIKVRFFPDKVKTAFMTHRNFRSFKDFFKDMKQIHQRRNTDTSMGSMSMTSFTGCFNESSYQNRILHSYDNIYFHESMSRNNQDFNSTLQYNMYYDYLHRSRSLDHLIFQQNYCSVQKSFKDMDEYEYLDSPNLSTPTSHCTGIVDNLSDNDINSVEFDNNSMGDKTDSNVLEEVPSPVKSYEEAFKNTCEFSKFKWMNQKFEDFDINKYDEPSQNSKGKRSSGESKQKKSHNDSERKRRKTINNAIAYLAQRIPSSGNQSKAKTLKNAGYFIDILLDENKRLKAELLNLYKILYC